MNVTPPYFFLIPADSKDHRKEFEILVNELEQYNPELLHKQFLIAISKADMLDDELKKCNQQGNARISTALVYFVRNQPRTHHLERQIVDTFE